MKTVIVDAVGEPCPIPVVKATKALRELGEPGTLEVRVDNEIAVQNLTRLANNNGYAVKSEKLGDKEFRMVMEVTGAPAAQSAGDDSETCLVPAGTGRNDTVVVISSELEELRQTCDRIAIVSGGKIAGILPASKSSEEFGALMVSQVV